MKKQVLVLHGGTLHETYEDYFRYLEEYPLEKILYKKEKRWKELLPERLGENFEVIAPSMPSTYTYNYEEWVVWIEKYFPILRDNVTLVGHSLGASFWLKYLNEKDFPVSIKSLHLVAAATDSTPEEPMGNFITPETLDGLTKRCSEVIIYHSRDDELVPYSQSEKLQRLLPDADLHIFDDRGHFIEDNLPEIVENILTD